MIRYILRRLVLMAPVAFLVTVGVFILVRLSPADPALVFLGEERDPAAIEQTRIQMGLDKPLPVQYVVWLSHVVQGDLGRSFETHQRVLEAIWERLPATVELGLAAMNPRANIMRTEEAELDRRSPLDQHHARRCLVP